MKEAEKKEALRLRIEEKLSLKQITEKTGLAKSTLSVLLRNYPLSDERIKELSIGSQIIGANANKQKAIERKSIDKSEGILMMKKFPSFRELCFLYWGEGSKYDGLNHFSISNTDRYMIKFVLNTIEELGCDGTIKLTCYCYPHSDENTIKEYWSTYLNRDIHVYKAKMSKASKGLIDRQPYGTMRIDVYSVKLLNNVMGALESIRGDLI
jgi:transcriptional regulator with XRE-family HTH domain